MNSNEINEAHISIYIIPSTTWGLGWVPLQDSCMKGLFYVHTQSRPCNMRHPRPWAIQVNFWPCVTDVAAGYAGLEV